MSAHDRAADGYDTLLRKLAEMQSLEMRAENARLREAMLRAPNAPDMLWNQSRIERIAKILATFYRAPLSMSSVQPVLTLAEELNPELVKR